MGYVRKNTKTKSELWLTIVSIILVVVVVASIVTAALSNTGVFLRISDAVGTENYEVNGAMLSYFYNEELRSWITNNATYIQYAALYPSHFGNYSVNFSSDLDSQTCKLIADADRTAEYTSWYDYFMGLTVETVSRYLEYAEGAKIAGVTLDDEDEKNIKESVNTLMSDLKANGYSLEDVYGTGVSKSDIKKCFELKEIAIKYAEIKIEELKVQLEKENLEVFQKYADDHKSEFYSAKYISYTIQEKEADYKTDAEYEQAKKDAKTAADLIASSTTPELFFEAIMKYEADKKAAEKETATTGSAETTTSKTETTTEAPEMEDYTKEVYYNTETSELDKWLFEENAAEGASKVIEETETVTTSATTTKATEETTNEETTTARTTKEVYKVTAYKVIKSNDINRDKTFDIGYVVTTDKAIAERILKDFEAGNMTAEALEKLGLAEAEKLGESSETAIDAATQDNAMPEYFSGFSKDLDTWLNSADLKAGSHTQIVEVKPTSDGGKTQYVICQFDQHGDEVWYANAFDGIMDERFEGWYEDMKVTKPISTKAKTLGKMSVSVYVQNLASQAASSSTSYTS